MSKDRIIMHIDVNSAFLSWQAVYNIQRGEKTDLREIPSAVGGNQADRHGIILAKSIPAKKHGVKTGEVIWQARQKCPELVIVPPNYYLYMKCSNTLYELMKGYSPLLQRFSIDELFLDYTGLEPHFGDPVAAAHLIKDHIREELGFTVNIGISHNKLLAKIAGDLKKPDMVHTLWRSEIPAKMWPLPVGDLFMVGRRTQKKLLDLNITTIGELANADIKLLRSKLKSYGNLIWCYANGLDESPVHTGYFLQMKGIGNSTTIRFDVNDYRTAYKVLLSLFNEAWKGEEIRHLGVRVTDLCCDEYMQASIFDEKYADKKQALDTVIDAIRGKYGNTAVMRAVFADYEFAPMTGGSGAEDYPVMSGIL